MSAQLIRLEAAPDLADQVYRTLVDAIGDGNLPPGQRLTQEDIAAKLAVSRQPVLQALRLLKADGLVQDAPGRGLQVAPLDAELIASVYQVRAALDRLAARLAAMQRASIDPRLIDHGRKAARGRDIRAMIDADLAFHQAIYAASGNPLIEPSALVHWRHVRRAMGASLQRLPMRETVWDEHQAIAAAIAAGKADRAEALISAHDERASEHMTRLMAAGDT